MEKKNKTISYRMCETSELPEPIEELFIKAEDAVRKAYAPYSKFKVGAAVLLSNGVIVEGNNQENVAYPSGLCAERVAMFYANSRYPDSAPVAIAITAFDTEGESVDCITPCGSCRQVLAETEKRFNTPIAVYLCGKSKTYIFDDMDSLLPFGFEM